MSPDDRKRAWERARAHADLYMLGAALLCALGMVAETSYATGYRQALEDQG